MLHGLLEDRRADLLRTCGAYGSSRFVKLQATRLERQTAMVEQPTHFALGVLDQIFVDDSVNASRQHRIEMRHQLDIVAIVPAHFRQAVSEALPSREVLLEAGQAAA